MRKIIKTTLCLFSIIGFGAISASDHHEITQELQSLRKSEYRLNTNINPYAKILLDKVDEERYIAKDESFWGRVKKRGTVVFPISFIRNIVDLVMLTEERAPKTYSLIKSVSEKLGLPMPMIYVAKNKHFFNAFASGLCQSMSIVVLGEKLVETTSIEALEFLIAHELSHIKKHHVSKNIGIKLGTLACTYFGLYTLGKHFNMGLDSKHFVNQIINHIILINLSSFFVAPIAGYYSRAFEKEADLSAAGIVGTQGGIELMETFKTKTPDIDRDFAYLEEEIENSPLKTDQQFTSVVAKHKYIEKLKTWLFYPFDSHSTYDERITYLQEFADQQATVNLELDSK